MQTYAIKWAGVEGTFLSMGEDADAAAAVDLDRHGAFQNPEDLPLRWVLESAEAVTDPLVVEMFARTGPSGMMHDGESWTVVLVNADGGMCRARLP